MQEKSRTIAALTLLLSAMAFAPSVNAQLNLPRPSQSATVKQTFGLTDIEIVYSRPGVKGREIWGGLVPYDKVWRTGANEATSIKFSTDVMVNGEKIAAGTYSFHTIPGKDKWTLIFNGDAKQWGSYSHDAAKDVLRINVAPAAAAHQEWMMFSFPVVSANSAEVELRWEKLSVGFKVEADVQTMAMKNIKESLAKMDDWQVPYRAANYVIESGSANSEEAMRWLDRSIALKATYWNLRVKANELAKAGKTAEAIATAEKAVKIGTENKDEPSEIAKTEKLIAEWKASVPAKSKKK